MQLTTSTLGSGSRSVALVHGMTASSLYWEPFAKLLVEEHDCTVTFVDLRGHGESPRADRYLIGDFADDLVDTLPVGLDLLIGQSLGGRTVMEAAQRLQPKRLIAIDPGLQPVRWFALLVRHGHHIQFRLPDPVLRRAMFGSALGKEEAAAAVAKVRAGWAKYDPAVRLGILESLGSPYVPAAPVVPSTIIKPVKSTVVPSSLVGELRRLGWDVREMPGVGHDLHVQDPAGALRVLADVIDA